MQSFAFKKLLDHSNDDGRALGGDGSVESIVIFEFTEHDFVRL